MERLSLMSPEERADYRVAQSEARLRNEMQQTRLMLQEEADRSAFRSLQSSNPLARKYAADVETVVAQQKSRGLTVSRETALKFVIGEKMFAKANAQTPKQKKAAASRIASASGRPTRSAGAQGSERGSRGRDESFEDLERRLANVVF